MIVYDVSEDCLFRERDKGGVLYAREDDNGVLLHLHRDGHFLRCFHSRPPVTVDDDGNPLSDPSYLVWKSDKLVHAVLVDSFSVVGPLVPQRYVLEASFENNN